MIADAHAKISVIIGEVASARFGIRIEKPQRVGNIGVSAAAQRPFRYGKMHLLGRHIVKILRLIGGALELSRRKHYVAYRVVPAVFALSLHHSVHDYGCDRAHTRFTLAAGFALNYSCQQLQVVHNTFYAERENSVTTLRNKKPIRRFGQARYAKSNMRRKLRIFNVEKRYLLLLRFQKRFLIALYKLVGGQKLAQ